MKSLKKKFPNFESFKDADITKVLDPKPLKEAYVLEANQMETLLLVNKGGFEFEAVDLPKEVQFSPIYAINHGDFDRDGDVDILMGGNLLKLNLR